ncbi:hypothetical protein AJ78_03890 [Emergomyces pasteurianus Ep9510]|uniref:Amino acid permease n=1 Tax=Emergomyces pasteurianus Ep9510 TaxID=1447872 RepID=A0A1J9PIQ5_9EURO|nr:hypothetical protein AJ78_03890 [Emergomyces pasteurianus Ep9510]
MDAQGLQSPSNLLGRGTFPFSGDRENDTTSCEDFGLRTVRKTSVKKRFNSIQIFFFALSFLSSWESILVNIRAVFVNGGPRGLAWGIFVAVSGALAQAASLAEMAAMQPVAGAQHHWTSHLAPVRYKRFITWMQGWITWFAWVSVLAGVANNASNLIQGLAVVNFSNNVPQRWHLTLIIFAILIVEGLMNVYTVRLIPWIQLMAGTLHVVLFVIFIIVFLAMAPRQSPDFVFFNGRSASGWESGFVSWNLGLLTPVWAFVGFDGAVHMGEEVRSAKAAIPRSIFYSVAINSVLAYTMIVIVLFSMGPLDSALNSGSQLPVIEIVRQATGSIKATTAMVSGLLVVSLSVNSACIASSSRLTWAWSRDGGLPEWFSLIDENLRVPVRAICLPIFLVMILACLNIASSTAFGAFIALSTIGLFVSYLIAIGCLLNARLRDKSLQFGEWNMGKLGILVNIYALVYTAWVIFWVPFPQYLPVMADNMNYSLPIFAAATSFALLIWMFYARKNWDGLNKEVVRLVVEGGVMVMK